MKNHKSTIPSHSPDFMPDQERDTDSSPEMHPKEIYEMQLKDIQEFEINLPKIEALIKDNKNERGSIDRGILMNAVKTYKRMKVLFNKVLFLCGHCGHLILAYPNYKALVLLICLTLLDFIIIFSLFSKIESLTIFGGGINHFFLFILLTLIATLPTFLLELLIISKRSFRRIFLKSKCDHCGKKVIDFERIIL